MVKTSQADVRRIADEILNYLEDHPNAADTAEGIAKWWLSRQRFEESAALVQQALNYLVSDARVALQTNYSGAKVYSGNKARTRKSAFNVNERRK
ncbi:MAG: hypothetical protein ACU836_16605 [Gammaproteobacteria bacterium]